MRKLKLAQKISLLVVVIVMISVGISIYVAGQYNIKSLMEKVKENTLNTVQIVAMSPIIIDGIANKESQEIQKFVEATQQQLKSIDIIVVADVNGKRYGHTKSNRVGKMFSAYDNDRAVLYGETYVSEGPGTLGPHCALLPQLPIMTVKFWALLWREHYWTALQKQNKTLP